MTPSVEELEPRDCPSGMPNGLPDIPNGAWTHVYAAEGIVYYQAGNIYNCRLVELPADVLCRVMAQDHGAFIPVSPVGDPFQLARLKTDGPVVQFIPDPVAPTADNPMPAPSATGTFVESRAWVTTDPSGALTLHAAYRDSRDGLNWSGLTEFAVPPELAHPITFDGPHL